MSDQTFQRTVHEETLGNVIVQVHRIDRQYRIVLKTDQMAYISPPLPTLEACYVEIDAMRELERSEPRQRKAA